MTKLLYELPAILTSFAFRKEYIEEMEGMIATIAEHHPGWPAVIGRGPVPGHDAHTLRVRWPSGEDVWSLPVPFDLDGSETDWHRIVMMKGWWLAKVWHDLGRFSSGIRRMIWLDADGRLNGPLDMEIDPEAEIVASPWWTDAATPAHQHHVCSGLVIFQGAANGVVDSILRQWADDCLRAISRPPAPSAYLPGPEGDQCLLTTVLNQRIATKDKFSLIKLDYDRYCGVPDRKDGKPKAGALVDQWMMNQKMRAPENRNAIWPPPEAARRRREQ